ncbi:hypothetical protein Agabi119p4_11724 [Agaricus bisporus var. burnettii]|uniref:F-box domain-containing protein n=1 Tax=Agaricus bisporus var. burnettii TaxID=192524 RepID=A0A8H7EV75_AGABI|nr:hypothetical protein Agabi119p4_11724 [Agaricus bisporus var. burnettii]
MDPHVANDLPNDILIIVLQSLWNDYHSLFQSALVNHAFYQAASKFLYRKVVLSPRYARIPSQDGGSDYSNLESATLPSYAKFVEIIEISRYLSCRPPPANNLSEIIFDAITQFKNLRVAIFTPITFHEDVFTDVLKYLGGSIPSSVDNSDISLPLRREAVDIPPVLQELVVNTSCTDEVRAPLLIQITGLSKLSIHSPTRAILQLLSDWLRRLSDTLTELHLKDNCGSVTPGVLRSFMPLLERNIQSLSIGLSYSLTDEDIFSVLHHLQNLRKVELRYYWQLRQPRTLPRLARLRSFTGYHINYQTRYQVRSLCKWIRRAITSSPIESLHLIQDDPDQPLPESLDTSSSSSSFDYDNDITISINTGAYISFRSLIDHICSCHSETLKILDMKNEYIDIKSLKNLIGCLSELEEMHICAGPHSLSVFKKHAPSSLSKLHTASFNIRNIRSSKRRVIDMELVTAIMRHGPPLLRRLSVNGQSWESSWKTSKNDHIFVLHIHKYHQPIPPWNKKYMEPPSPSPSPPSSSSSSLSSSFEEKESTRTQSETYPHPSTEHFTLTTTTTTTPPPPTASRPQRTTSILTTTSSPMKKNTVGGGGPHVRFSEPKEIKLSE